MGGCTSSGKTLLHGKTSTLTLRTTTTSPPAMQCVHSIARRRAALAVASVRSVESLVRSYIPRKDQDRVLELVSHLVMLEPDPKDLQAMVNHQQAQYEGRFCG